MSNISTPDPRAECSQLPEDTDNILHKPAKADAHLLERNISGKRKSSSKAASLWHAMRFDAVHYIKQLEFFWLSRVPSVNGPFLPFLPSLLGGSEALLESKHSTRSNQCHSISALGYGILKGALLGKLLVKTRMLTDDRKARLM